MQRNIIEETEMPIEIPGYICRGCGFHNVSGVQQCDCVAKIREKYDIRKILLGYSLNECRKEKVVRYAT